MTWTADRVEVLKKLWSEGESASAIAAQLGGITRNAVIGKVHRMGIEGRATPSRPKKPRRLAKETDKAPIGRGTKKISRPDIISAQLRAQAHQTKASVIPGGVPITEIGARQCRFGVTPHHVAPGDHRFCGAESEVGKSYCPAHVKQVEHPTGVLTISDDERARRRRQGIKNAQTAARRKVGLR